MLPRPLPQRSRSSSVTRPTPIHRTPSAYAYPLLIKQLLHAPLAVNPEQEIVYRGQVRHSYWTMRHRIGQLASGLQSLGIAQGDTVAVMDWDSHRYLESYFGIPMMGAVLMTVNVRLSPEQIAYTLNHAGVRLLMVHADFLPVVAAIRDQLESVECLVLIGDDTLSLESAPLAEGFVAEYETLLAASPPDYPFPDFDENARATTFYTTGTTGLPKGVYFSHRQIVLHTLATMAALTSAPTQGRVHRDDVYMPLTPMFHVHAWGMPFVATALGMKQVYPGRYAADQLLQLVQSERITFSHGVPTLLNMILSHPDSAAVDLSGMKIIVGGSALPRGLAQAAIDRGIDVFTGYGMSETCPILTLAQVKTSLLGNATTELDVRTKTGLPVPLVDLRIVDDEMRDIAHDGKASGEIVVRAPWLTQGYFGNAAESEHLWAGGYLHTNDIGSIDSDGYLQVTDRIKDVIKSGGEWVSSLELEDLISRHAAVSEVAVIGIKDARWGERPLPLIVLRPGQSAGAEEIQEHLRDFVRRGAISKYAVPERVLFVEAIEKTSVGKINKRLLRDKYQAAPPPSPNSGTHP
ncbi:fatty acid--CoA ligase [Cupriavidus necator H16]|uniref:Fatty acid--CoA ligase n=1 Tax=Cupriavidus necator (strain ATCC 17699 / DSM 428 / KCTC 22496 / NCIMB 10442 / H16 / Stanier 337) TaxID=381666 RepID=A0AAE5ZJV8_CUPNH|nr:fatty acid--CoA ligase [Cupriavidus necator]QCC03989.1 fatty acid--CoA ligase [Cupriavidus necator H16]QQB81049.1 fatty acid--CoA ligase [Cupriavidus necator]WKA42885.1 fatty acid--CoA ligase [Cupriavidus necator]